MQHAPRLGWLLSIACLTSCNSPRDLDGVREAERLVTAGRHVEALQVLHEGASDAESFASSVLSSEALQSLLDEPEARRRIRALIQERARGSDLRMVGPQQPGDRVHVTIQVTDRATGDPVVGARVDIVHTDAAGRYGPPGETGEFNPRLFGTAVTDARGAISVRTIRPRHYAEEYDQGEPAHIHFTVFVDGRLRRAAEFFFEDDPRVTDEFVRAMQSDPLPIASVRRTARGEWAMHVTIPIGWP